MLCLGIALLVFTGLQSWNGIFWNCVRGAVKPVPMIPRLASAGEGPGSIVADGCPMTSVFRTFVNIRTLVSGANKAGQAGTAEGTASMVNAPGLPLRGTGVTAIQARVGRWGDQDTSVPVICEFIAAAALAPVAPRQVDTHGIGAAAMETSGTLINVHTAPSVTLEPGRALAGVVHTRPRVAPCCCVTGVAPVIARIHCGRGRVHFNRANLIGHSKPQHALLLTVQSKGPVHSQLLGGRDSQVSGGMTARLVSDVLVDAVGPSLVDRTRNEGETSGTGGCHD